MVFTGCEVKWSEVKCSAVKGGKSGRNVNGIYGLWSEVKGSAVKGGKSGRNVNGIYGLWSEVKWSEG